MNAFFSFLYPTFNDIVYNVHSGIPTSHGLIINMRGTVRTSLRNMRFEHPIPKIICHSGSQGASHDCNEHVGTERTSARNACDLLFYVWPFWLL